MVIRLFKAGMLILTCLNVSIKVNPNTVKKSSLQTGVALQRNKIQHPYWYDQPSMATGTLICVIIVSNSTAFNVGT